VRVTKGKVLGNNKKGCVCMCREKVSGIEKALEEEGWRSEVCVACVCERERGRGGAGGRGECENG
jgi:hypothetical protein